MKPFSALITTAAVASIWIILTKIELENFETR
jgi:hypothetical protein